MNGLELALGVVSLDHLAANRNAKIRDLLLRSIDAFDYLIKKNVLNADKSDFAWIRLGCQSFCQLIGFISVTIGNIQNPSFHLRTHAAPPIERTIYGPSGDAGLLRDLFDGDGHLHTPLVPVHAFFLLYRNSCPLSIIESGIVAVSAEKFLWKVQYQRRSLLFFPLV